MKLGVQKIFRVWARRFLLLLLGFICTVLFWEGVFSILATQKNYNTSLILPKKDQKAYTILALGESTTAQLTGPAWPEYLETLLNQRSEGEKFQVINAGVSGTTTKEVSGRIDGYISLYQPNMVISMLGINDLTYPDSPALAKSPYQRVLQKIFESRVYRFISILVRQIVGKQSKALMIQASKCTYASMGEEAFQVFDTQTDVNRESAILAYLSTYPFSFHGYERIVDFYATNNKWADVSRWVDRAHYMDPYIRFCARQASIESKDRFEELSRHIDWMFYYIGTLENVARNAQDLPESVDATWYKQTANMLHTPQSDTNWYYPRIAGRLRDAGVAHIAMQYPMISVDDLKKMLGEVRGIEYVSNEGNFQEALQTYTYDDLFVDHFTGVFGHTTAQGSKIIAESLVPVVLRIARNEIYEKK